MKIPNKQGLPKLALNHSPGIDFKDLGKSVHKMCCLMLLLHQIIFVSEIIF